MAWLLVNQTTWWKVLKPKRMHQFASMHEEEDLNEEHEEQRHFPLSPEVPVSPVCGSTRSRSEDDEDERRVRQRVESGGLLSADETQQPVLVLSSERSTPLQAGSVGTEQKTADLARVMERRLELDIMTHSEVGLSVEAKEYLFLQRRLILQNLKETTLHQP
ncbi:hypothetical protein PI124_g4286 [Phytophthora idaei]|nr:hypothetical protein PI125_g3419 [Phytophthora idaei]KAG3164480.1 hypothetical protein PI126_g5075 [Phytophthora idaei]KAG3251083.1 hypothetical protein PI124_g4286 [Phytophthora idaei]